MPIKIPVLEQSLCSYSLKITKISWYLQKNVNITNTAEKQGESLLKIQIAANTQVSNTEVYSATMTIPSLGVLPSWRLLPLTPSIYQSTQPAHPLRTEAGNGLPPMLLPPKGLWSLWPQALGSRLCKVHLRKSHSSHSHHFVGKHDDIHAIITPWAAHACPLQNHSGIPWDTTYRIKTWELALGVSGQ